MATTKTVKPAGGGDFSTLQAWEDWASSQTSTAQWAECYSGGNLGTVDMYDWNDFPAAPDLPRIYAATGHRHTGLMGTGAYISTASEGVIAINLQLPAEVIGIRFNLNNGCVGVYMQGDGFHTMSGIVVDSCLFEAQSGKNPDWGVFVEGAPSPGITGCTIRNCIMYPGMGTGIVIDPRSGGACTGIVVDNNTTAGAASGYGIWGRNQFGVSGGDLEATIRNNVCMNCFSADFNLITIRSTYTISNNMSSDITAGGFGGTDNITNQPAAPVFVNTVSDLRLKRNSPALDKGVTIAGNTTDALGVSRPQNNAYDMGAFEFYVKPIARTMMI